MHIVPEINLTITALLFTLYNKVKCFNKCFLMTVILYSHRNFTCSYENIKNNNNSPNVTNRQPQCLMLKSRLLIWLLKPSLSCVSPSPFGWSLSWLNGLTVLNHLQWDVVEIPSSSCCSCRGQTHLSCKMLENAIWGSQTFWADHLLCSRCSCASSNLIAPVIVSKEGEGYFSL